MPKEVDVSEEFLAEETPEQLTEAEKTVEEPAVEPKRVETVEKPPEDDWGISPEELSEILGQVEEEITAPAPAKEEKAKIPAVSLPDLPAEIYQITPQKYMPEGEEFDPSEAFIPGTPSQIATVRAQVEQARQISRYERELWVREQQMAKAMQDWENFIRSAKERGYTDEQIQRFTQRISSGSFDPQILFSAYLLEQRRLAQKRPSQGAGARRETLAPVTAATRVIEKPMAPDEADKVLDELIGPKTTW